MTSARATGNLAAAAEQQEWMRDTRRHLHAHPEVGLQLPATADVVREVLTGLGLDIETDAVSSGISARMTGTTGQTVVLRADMDALPLAEHTDLEFASVNPGSMHACGHDMHTTMLLATARALATMPERHDVVFAFQAGEEFDRGALPLLDHRNLREVGQARTFALHMHAQRPVSTFHWRRGSFMGFGDWFRITITGSSGHASSPQLARSPIPALAFLAERIDAITDLTEQPWPTSVATVTETRAGNSVNVIPDSATLRGTLRGRDEATIITVREQLADLCATARRQFGIEVDLDLQIGYPAVINDAGVTDEGIGFVERLASVPGMSGIGAVAMPEASMVIEDYSYFLQRWPGTMMYLGAQVDGCTSFNHSADVLFDESAMTVGCAYLLTAATS